MLKTARKMKPNQMPGEGIDCEACIAPAPQEKLLMHSDGTSTLQCVKCPFCKRIVDAHMTKTSISCPECKAEVQYT